jgi:hypothetical protein
MASSVASNDGDHLTAQETTPLLAASAAGATVQTIEEQPNHDIVGKNDGDKPLPKAQIFLLSYARLFEAIAFFSIFPFISQMIWETGEVKEADVGFYSGLMVKTPPRLWIL